ncbi:Neuroligin-4, X-linked [Nymphon striatum]|nr:Neuroligin-4, X-linked [Nymphon striatum]
MDSEFHVKELKTFPERAGRWSGVRDTTRFQPSCPHMHRTLRRVVGNEDCLYMNVYTPSVDPGNGFNLISYPVLVFIHGPDYTTGSGNIYGAERLVEKGNVVVTFNYRLGSLGFLSTADNESPGNYGLHDQNLALKWVKRNINQFQGDPNNIALAGQGAGAAMVSMHMISPLSKGLFLRAITESGNALCSWAVDEKPRITSADNAQKLGRLLSCGSGYIETSFLVRCLKNRLVTDLIENQEKLKGFGTFPGIWKPVVDSKQNNKSKVFLQDTPRMLMARGDITGRDLITGVNKDEGSITSTLQPQVEAVEETLTVSRAISSAKLKRISLSPSFRIPLLVKLNFFQYFLDLLRYMPNIAVDSFYLENNLLPNFLGNLTQLYGNAVVRQVYTKYFANVNSRQSAEVIKAFTKMATDALFVGCNDEWARTHSRSSVFTPNDALGSTNTYMYVFTYDGENSFVEKEADAIGAGISKLFETVQFTDGEYKPWLRLTPSSNSYYEIGRDLNDMSSYRLVESQMWSDELPKLSTFRPTTPFPTNLPATVSRLQGEQSQPYKTATWAMLAIIIALIILCIFLCCLLISSKRKREFKAEPDVYH